MKVKAIYILKNSVNVYGDLLIKSKSNNNELGKINEKI
ncbi:hypothetical protein P20495_2815 [Pseudoalteromonas sp. BSi20495]|nr:hypothetical protein P20495_2815 [Pseudoalteromonas sp. BSi20495]